MLKPLLPVEIVKSRKTALLVGATGLVGRHCLHYLLSHEAYTRVRVLTRRSVRIRDEKLEEHLINFDRLADYAPYMACNDVFICLGTTMSEAGSKEAFYQVDFTYAYETARLAQEQGANQLLLVSSIGANPDAYFFYPRVKGELEHAVADLPYWAIRIFRPSVLIGERPASRWGERIASTIAQGVDRLTGGALSRYRPIEAELVAKAMVQTAQSLNGGLYCYSSDQIPELAGEIAFYPKR